jgi:hypothetical protein
MTIALITNVGLCIVVCALLAAAMVLGFRLATSDEGGDEQPVRGRRPSPPTPPPGPHGRARPRSSPRQHGRPRTSVQSDKRPVERVA